MNAIDLLKEDHNVVDALFKRVEDTPPSRHPPIFKRIKGELDTHAHVEEKIFYPALQAKGDKELKDITAEAFEEHAQMKKFLKEIGRATDKEKREAKLKVLIEDTRHHVKEEEYAMFPLVRKQFSRDELEKLGDSMESEKVKFQKAKSIRPRPPQAKGMMEKVLDKAKEVVDALLPDDGNGRPARAKGGSKKSATGARSAKSTDRSSSTRSGSGSGGKPAGKGSK